MKFRLILFLFSLIFCTSSYAQQLTREQVNDTISQMPSFSIYKDNYFISGVPVNTGISEETADAKYQISFKQLLTRNTLPLRSYLFITYTQKSFWNLYEFSSPFADINFTPAIVLGKPVFDNNDKLLGMAFLKAEHESNGRDSIYSRSWNKIALSFHAAINEKMTLSIEGWYPFRYKKDNPDLLEYVGPGEINLSYDIRPRELTLDVMLRKGLNWEWKGAVRTRLMYSPFEMRSHYFMLEWYHGHAESLIDYSQFRSMIRFGFVFKSNDLNFIRPVTGRP